MQKPVIALTVLVNLLIVAACSSRTPTPTLAPPTAPLSATPRPGLALVSSIDVSAPTQSGGEAKVVVHGQLDDSCTSLAAVSVERQAQVFVVTLTTARQAQANCAPASPDYQREVALKVADLPAGDYIVVVNGVTGNLRLGTTTVAQTSPSATATPAAAATGQPTTAAPTQAPTQSPTPVTAPGTGASAGNCIDKAAFYGDVNVPDDTPFKQGEKFTKTWKVRNEGTCLWKGYQLIFAGGDNMSGPLSSPLPEAAPDKTIEVSVDLVSPTRGGPQISNWEFQDAEGRRFGVGASGQGPLWVQISVAFSGQESVVPPPDTVGSGVPVTGANPCNARRQDDFENQVLSLINSVRSANGLPAVSLQTQLGAAAAEHAQDMACHDFISHTGTDGTTWKNRVANQGYANYNSAREIIYAGDVSFGASPQGAVDWWMNSPVHHDIVLNPTVTQLGIACAINPNNAGWAYYTVVFARP